MAVNTKTIKRRIKSIGSTKKITKAMEMISAVKMRRAVGKVLSTRSYAKLAWEILTDIAAKTDISHHPLLEKRDVKKIALIFITSNRGLAGGFTSRLLTETNNYINSCKAAGQSVDIILSGRRGKKIYTRFGHSVMAEFDKMDLTARIEEILPIAQIVVKDYIDGKYDQIVVAYTDFASALQQVPTIKKILPLEDRKREQIIKDGFGDKVVKEFGYTFEPEVKRVLDVLLPRMIEMQIYHAILESDASEHSARMIAMRNASDAASDMIKELNYSYNKARQAAITQEISEIVGGAAALD